MTDTFAPVACLDYVVQKKFVTYGPWRRMLYKPTSATAAFTMRKLCRFQLDYIAGQIGITGNRENDCEGPAWTQGFRSSFMNNV